MIMIRNADPHLRRNKKHSVHDHNSDVDDDDDPHLSKIGN